MIIEKKTAHNRILRPDQINYQKKSIKFELPNNDQR